MPAAAWRLTKCGRVVDGDPGFSPSHHLPACSLVATIKADRDYCHGNFGLFKAFDSYENVGSKYVRCMNESGTAWAGVEWPIIFGDLAKTGDGILTSLRIIRSYEQSAAL